jgi:hypothetical protein
MGKLEKMSLTACTVKCNGDMSANGKNIEVMINPETISHKHSISYNNKVPWGSIAEDLKFDKINAETVDFSMYLDGTGVVPVSSQSPLTSIRNKFLGSPDTVTEMVDNLKEVVYQYDGSEHQPSPVRLMWGTFIFFGRLTSLNMEYTLFKPSGEPLRAKADLSFTGYMSKEEEALRKNKSSPDLTHTIEVKAGDTLPLLCYKVYSDPSYYPEVARINGLNSLQELRPGRTLQFPPLA